MATRERTSYCLPCDRVITWKSWTTWQAHIRSAEHRECLLAPRPLPADRLRPADLGDDLYGLAPGESVVFRRPDGRWIGLAALEAGDSLRVEGTQQGLVIERLRRHLGPAAEPKRLCLRCQLILDPVIFGHHYTSRGHRERKEPDLEAEPIGRAAVEATRPREPGAGEDRIERLSVTMAPLTLTVADAARVIGLSRSTISELARSGTIPSLRVGSRVLVPVKALEEWLDGRLAEDADRHAAAWVRLRDYGRSASAPQPVRQGRGRPRSRQWG